MKLKLLTVSFLLTTWFARGQGIVVYDQQSTNLIEGAAGLYNSFQPMGQSFTPLLSSVGFVSLDLYDGDPLHVLGGTVYVNLRSNSITGTILGVSAAVFMPDAFFGKTNCIFSIPVPVTPGVTYYFQPVIQSGNLGLASYITDGSYAGGSEIYQGIPLAGQNLWFQEGVVFTPEPSSLALGLVGIGCFALCLFKNYHRRRT